MALWYKWLFKEAPEPQWSQGRLKADVRIPADSPWFDGHFPGKPLLPGVAQLGLVRDLIRRASGRPGCVVRVSRVRFKQMILPDQPLNVTVEAPDSSGCHRFRISSEQGVISTGQLWLAAETEDNATEGAQGKPLR